MARHRQPVPGLTVRGSRPLPVVLTFLAIVAGVVALPHLFVSPPSAERAAQLVRDAKASEVARAYAAYYQSARPGAADPVARAYADSLEAARARRFAQVQVRTSWLSPLLARRTQFLIEIRERPGSPAEYYVTSGVLVRRSSRVRWALRLF